MGTLSSRPLFPTGRIVATPGALRALERAGEDASQFLARHSVGDWGDIDPGDVGLNQEALQTGARILSVYYLRSGQKLWIISEADRSATTLLLPQDY